MPSPSQSLDRSHCINPGFFVADWFPIDTLYVDEYDSYRISIGDMS